MSSEQWIERLRRAATSHEVDAEMWRQRMTRAKREMDTALQSRDDLLNAVTDVLAAKEKAEALDGQA